MHKILVIGSSNTDLIAKVDHFPVAGETIEGKFFLQTMGGKGANQALAAHRSGGNVSFVTCLGSDTNGQNTMDYYQSEGLDVSSAFVVNDVATGTAMILVNDEGENFIVITPGANNKLSASYIASLEKKIAEAYIVVLQMEIPIETIRKVCELAVKHNTKVLMNVAPARELDDDLISMVDFLVVNETEIEKVSGHSIAKEGEEKIMNSLLAKGAKTVILTVGKNGCYVKNQTINERIPAFQVEVIDTTAAGDTFCGALVAQLSMGSELNEAIKYATAASAICVTRMGAQPAIPKEEEVRNFLNMNVTLTENYNNTNK